MREHLDRADLDVLDAADAVRDMTAAAERLKGWHDSGQKGPRPPGRLTPHSTEKLPWFQRWWATPAYRLVYDPDGRSWRDRRANRW
jgi:hypothetical protein